MKSARYSVSRQKACRDCVAAKARCSKTPGACSRCIQRGLACVYPDISDSPRTSRRAAAAAAAAAAIGVEGHGGIEPELTAAALTPSTIASQNTFGSDAGDEHTLGLTLPHHGPTLTQHSAHLNFTSLKLTCPVNADDIRSRWINPYIPLPEQVSKDYDPRISDMISRILNSYARSAVRGKGVPGFVHPTQLKAQTSPSQPLTTCLSIVRMCENPLPGSEDVVADVLQRDMSKIHDSQSSYDDANLLAAFQAYLIYMMVLYFRMDKWPEAFPRQTIMNLEDLASSAARGGLACAADETNARPRWEEWIVAEAKRRTLYVMYLLDNILSRRDGLPTFLGTELRGLGAPCSKYLWEARTRQEWEVLYNRHLAEWPEGGLRIDELWGVPSDMEKTAVVQRRERVDQWLEDVDEFAMMIYAVTSCTHGG